MSSNQTHLTSLFLSLSLSSKPCSPNCPSASPQKIPSSSLVFQKNNIFHRVMWAFWISLSRSESSHRENRKARTFLPLHLFSLSWASLFLFLSFSHVSFHLPSPLTPPHPPSSFSLSPLFPLVFVCSSLLGSLVSLWSHEEDERGCLLGPSLWGISGSEGQAEAPESLAGLWRPAQGNPLCLALLFIFLNDRFFCSAVLWIWFFPLMALELLVHLGLWWFFVVKNKDVFLEEARKGSCGLIDNMFVWVWRVCDGWSLWKLTNFLE